MGPGTRLGRYVLESRLGEGRVGVVYRARDRELGTPYALKVLAAPTEDLERLVRRATETSAVRHANVVHVEEVLQSDDGPVIVSEYVPGPSVERWLRRYQPTTEEALALFTGIGAGLSAGHAAGLVHGSLSPGNVLLCPNRGRMIPKISDFGMARGSRRSGRPKLAAPGYASPERLRGEAFDRRADVWSLGALLYRLVVGVPAFEGDDGEELVEAVIAGDHVGSRAVRPELPERVHAALDALLRLAPDERPGTVGAVLDFLAGSGPTLASGSTGEERATARDGAGGWLAAGSDGARVALDMSGESVESAPRLARSSGGDAAPAEARRKPEAPKASPKGSTSRDTPDGLPPPPVRPRPSWLWWAGVVSGVAAASGLVLAVAVGALVALVRLTSREGVGWPEGGEPPVAEVREVPEVAAPALTEPALAEPMPTAAPTVAPEPTVAPALAAEPAPEPAPTGSGPGRVTFEGADAVWLVGPAGEVRELGAVPAGRYQVQAQFGGAAAAVTAAEIDVPAGGGVRLRCVAEMARCRVVR